jgi:4-hydroxy-tetrahydrodipicolinate synthase
MKKLHGAGVALVTPFDQNRNIDFDSLGRVLNSCAEKGVDYYVVLGTTGEASTLDKAEKAEVLKFVKENNPANLPIVYGLGGNNTNELLELVKETDLHGVDAILSVSPYYNKPPQEGIFQHYTVLADASPVPVILYNIPGRTGSNITASTTLRLAEHPNIIGVKEGAGDLEQAMEISNGKPEDFMLISGDDILTLPLIAVGAVGAISALANAYGDYIKGVFTFTAAGDYEKAQQAIFKMMKINPLMYVEGNPVGIKQVMKNLGLCENHVRLPLVPASQGLQEEIAKIMKEIN